MKTGISVVFATLNRLEQLKKAVANIEAVSSGVNYELVICNGNSTDGTTEWLKEVSEDKKNIKVLECGDTGGCGKAFNAGFKAASYDQVLSFNDDAVFVGTFTDLLSEAVDHLIIPFGPEDELPRFMVTSPWGAGDYIRSYGNFALTRRSLGDKVGWWGPYCKHYGGDERLSAYLYEMNANIKVSLKCRIIHRVDHGPDCTPKYGAPFREIPLECCTLLLDEGGVQ